MLLDKCIEGVFFFFQWSQIELITLHLDNIFKSLQFQETES